MATQSITLPMVERAFERMIGNQYIVECPLQLIHDSEIGGEQRERQDGKYLNVEVEEFVRKKRRAKEDARAKKARIQLYEDEKSSY